MKLRHGSSSKPRCSTESIGWWVQACSINTLTCEINSHLQLKREMGSFSWWHFLEHFGRPKWSLHQRNDYRVRIKYSGGGNGKPLIFRGLLLPCEWNFLGLCMIFKYPTAWPSPKGINAALRASYAWQQSGPSSSFKSIGPAVLGLSITSLGKKSLNYKDYLLGLGQASGFLLLTQILGHVLNGTNLNSGPTWVLKPKSEFSPMWSGPWEPLPSTSRVTTDQPNVAVQIPSKTMK